MEYEKYPLAPIHSFAFNFELFIINDKPLKFSFVGYKQQYGGNLFKLIDTFGGKLTEPNSPGAIVFVDRKHSSEIFFEHYDMRFIYDSIAAQKLQNLEDYRITTLADENSIKRSTKRRRTNSTYESGFHSDDDRKSATSDEFDYLATSEKHKNIRIEPKLKFRRQDHIDGTIAPDDTSSQDLNGEISLCIKDELSCFEEATYIDIESEIREQETYENHHELTSDESRNIPILRKSGNDLPKISSGLRKKSRKFTPWIEEEHQEMINFLIENNGIYLALSVKIWEKCLKTSALLQNNRRSAPTLCQRYRNFLRHDYAKYTNDLQALQQFKDMEVDRPRYGYIKRGFEVGALASDE